MASRSLQTVGENLLIPASFIPFVVVVVLWLGRTSYVAEAARTQQEKADSRVDTIEQRVYEALTEVRATTAATDAKVETILKMIEDRNRNGRR